MHKGSLLLPADLLGCVPLRTPHGQPQLSLPTGSAWRLHSLTLHCLVLHAGHTVKPTACLKPPAGVSHITSTMPAQPSYPHQAQLPSRVRKNCSVILGYLSEVKAIHGSHPAEDGPPVLAAWKSCLQVNLPQEV